jgi:hypothetical protein
MDFAPHDEAVSQSLFVLELFSEPTIMTVSQHPPVFDCVLPVLGSAAYSAGLAKSAGLAPDDFSHFRDIIAFKVVWERHAYSLPSSAGTNAASSSFDSKTST